ncbi:bifunctional UDP-4-keto-pentose/UDP-xylose synthase [Teredinibacter sp. KSP-S5-2]|uniref:bifunctional UDP-4-keto-pentose/UDP-xylose synthase n=1 Tax=Teredinibacter sp. KSP-S5-2 TaxID=3034506 RepID=UPI0029347C33|nr:bifunctional UDP-4-keto-pentose/UDP-xylose synthase [Teredinibacter sp. KSP-S5-2]WNO08358.1 bifunctional UDP-4-keto-pentose/UDP-xylose synthase [Teredinibacter sp. KSP-S5-2]
MNIFILGINGFIGNELTDRILNTTDWRVCGIDIHQNKIESLLKHTNFTFKLGDINQEKNWVYQKISEADIIIPLAAIATPKSYVENPLGVYQSVFETNIWLIKECARLKKRLIFPSTSEVYGMCTDDEFKETESNCVLGPIEKERWIYSCSKQLLDRVIWAYGHKGLPFTLFRPFNWIGASQDSVDFQTAGNVRVLPQFIGNILRSEPIYLVGGGEQRRSFTDIEDGIDALMKIIENKDGKAHGKIFNIGNKTNNYAIREIADIIIQSLKHYPDFAKLAEQAQVKAVTEKEFYGNGYQDVQQRIPDVSEIEQCLGWSPKVTLEESINKIVAHHLNTVRQKRIAEPV